MPKINREEYEVLKELDDKWKWIARNYNGALITYTDKPTKNPNLYWDSFGERMEDRLFQFIQWSNSEPYNIAELIEEYECSAEHVSHVVNERVKALGKAWSESEEKEVKKNIEWAKQKIMEQIDIERKDYRELEGNTRERSRGVGTANGLLKAKAIINQLDEPETLSQEWIDEHKETIFDLDEDFETEFIKADDLQNLLVPKQEEVDQAYKDGYETGKKHAFEKVGWKDKEPETVADVVINFWKSYERLKEVMNMEVEELEE